MEHILGFSCDTVSDCINKANNPAFYAKLRELNIAQTKKDIATNTPIDVGLIQTINALEEVSASLTRSRILLREFYSWYAPEFCRVVSDDELLNEVSNSKKKFLSAMGVQPSADDLILLKCVANSISTMKTREALLNSSLEQAMQTLTPNLTAVAGFLLGAKLIALAGSIKQLAFSSSSFVQLLGAEKALFRHVITGAKSPKHGVIITHPLVQASLNKGRSSRILAGKIVLASRVDFFKGAFIGDELHKSVEVQICKK